METNTARPNAADILAQVMGRNLRTAEVDAPGWGKVRVRQMSLRDRGDMNQQRRDGAGDAELAAFVVCRCAVNEDGTRMFDDKEAVHFLDADPAPIDAIAKVALELSSVTKEDVKEAEKNSAAGQTGDSSIA